MKAWKLFILFVGIGVLAGATVTSFQRFTAQVSTECKGTECVRKGGNSWCKQKGMVCELTDTRPCFVCVEGATSTSSASPL